MLQAAYQQFEGLVTLTENKLGDDTSSVIYVLINAFTDVLMIAWVKVHVDDVDPLQTQSFRGILMSVLIVLFSMYKNISLAVPSKRADKLRILRNVLSSLFNVLTFFIITKIPLSTVMIIQTSCPFFIAFIDNLYHKTTYTKIEAIFSFVSMFGVVFIVKPDLFFNVEVKASTGSSYAEGSERIFWTVIYVIGLVFYSISVVLLKALKTMHPMAMNFPFGLCLAASSAILEIFHEQIKYPSTWVYLQILVILGLVTFINQYSFVRANQLGKPAKVAMIKNVNVVFSFLFEIVYLNEVREWYAFAGAVLIVGSSVILSISRLS